MLQKGEKENYSIKGNGHFSQQTKNKAKVINTQKYEVDESIVV